MSTTAGSAGAADQPILTTAATGGQRSDPARRLASPGDGRRRKVPTPAPDVAGTQLAGLPGVGPGRVAAYAAAGLREPRHLLYHFPARYRRRPAPVALGALVAGETGALCAEIQRTSLRRRGRRSVVSVRVADDAGRQVSVLLFNRAYLAAGLPRGRRLWAAGRVVAAPDGGLRLLASDYELLAEDSAVPGERWLAVYRLPAGVPPAVHRRAVALLLLRDPPADWRAPRDGEPALATALAAVHQPRDLPSARAARARLVADEAYALSFEVALRRREAEGTRAAALRIDDARHAEILSCLPHRPTGAQFRVIGELRRDLSSTRPMARLLQGDVGSGKTLVALYALLAAAAEGRQGALMAPTEVLAAQHAAGLRALLAAAPGGGRHDVALLAGPAPAAERRRVAASLADGSLRLVVGTHALAGGALRFADLALVVVDEQQRFGVRQRVALRGKGEACHLLVVSATPIPRTLALAAYGELDLSLLDELPPGRSPRVTRYVPPARQAALWRDLRREVEAGARGYVVCPSIDGGPAPGDPRDLRDARDLHARGGRGGSRGPDDAGDSQDAGEEGHSVRQTLAAVRERLGPAVAVGAVHGRLPAEQRDAALDDFRAGRIQVLVATSLIEVGLDVSQASFVVVPDPARFGLASLHQIRGRVGRGERPGRCFLLGPCAAPAARARIEALEASEDGFALAEKDLQLRGPGEILGTRQSGLPGFTVLDPVADVAVLARTREEVLTRAADLTRDELLVLREQAFPRLALVPENLLAGG